VLVDNAQAKLPPGGGSGAIGRFCRKKGDAVESGMAGQVLVRLQKTQGTSPSKPAK